MFRDGADVILHELHKLACAVAPAELVIRGLNPEMDFILDIYGFNARNHKPRRFAINLDEVISHKNPGDFVISRFREIAARWAADNQRMNIEEARP